MPVSDARVRSPLGVRVAGVALGASVLIFAMCTLVESVDPVTRYLESGRTDVALATAVERGYMSSCRADTKASAVTVAQAYSAFGIESHCRCAMDWFLQHAEEQDLRALLERDEITTGAQVTQAAASDHCRDELTMG